MEAENERLKKIGAKCFNPKKWVHTNGKRKFVEIRKITATYPGQYLEMNIKYIWLEGWRCNSYLLTVLDVYGRKVLIHTLLLSIRQQQVVSLLEKMLPQTKVQGITIRNDNGSQFITHSVRD